MPNTNDEGKEKIWCSAFSNCFSRGPPSKTWVASTTDAVIGLGCKVLDGEPDESCSSSPIEKGEEAVCTLQPQTQSEHNLIPLVIREQQAEEPDPKSDSLQEFPETYESHSSSSSLIQKISPQLSCENFVEEDNCNSLKTAILVNQEEISECSDIGSTLKTVEPFVNFITPFVNQESEICDTFNDTIPSAKCSEDQELPGDEITLNAVIQPNESTIVSTNANKDSNKLLETEVLKLEKQNELKLATACQPETAANLDPPTELISETAPQSDPVVNTDLPTEKLLTFLSQGQEFEEFVVYPTETPSEQTVCKDFNSEELLTEIPIELGVTAGTQLKNPGDPFDVSVPLEESSASFVTKKPNKNGVAVPSVFANKEVTAELTETKIFVEGQLLESLSEDSLSLKEEKPHRSQKSNHSPTEKTPVVLPSSSAAETILFPDTHLAMESLTAGTEMLSISSLEDNLSSREVSPSSDDLLETLAYVPDLDDTEDVDLEIDGGVLPAEDKLKVLKNADNRELNATEITNTPNDNTPAAPVTPATDNNPPTITATTTTTTTSNAVPSVKTIDPPTNNNTTTTGTSNNHNSNNNNKKKNKKNAVTNNAAPPTAESSKADNKNNNANLSAKNEQKKVEVKDPAPKPQKPNSKNKKKDDKSNDHILRALSSLSTPEEKLAALCKKYADLNEENRELGVNSKQTQRKLAVLTRQKEQLQLENNKAVMAKSQLESLCRELQKHNRLIKEESLARAKEEDEKRKEISAKFQTTINEIQTQMVDNHDRNMKLREENTELASKLKTFLEQYEQREKYFEKIVKHRELEQQLADAKLKQASMQLVEEKERNKQEREFMLKKATETDRKMILLEKQVKTYKDQYSEFQSTITRSNDMFSKLRGEMDKMTVKIKKLEKDSAAWKSKWENCNKALLGMIDQKTTMDKERLLLQTKIQKLESLCRAQQERLRAQKSPPPAEECQKCCSAESCSTPSSNDNKMSADLAQPQVTNSSAKTDVTADHGTPAEKSCVTPDNATPAVGSTLQTPDSLPDQQPTENPSSATAATVSECSAASPELKKDTVADTTTNETPVQSCHTDDNNPVGDSSNCSSTNKENLDSDNKPVVLVDHTAPVKSCPQTT